MSPNSSVHVTEGYWTSSWKGMYKIEAALQLMQYCPVSSWCRVRAYDYQAQAEVVNSQTDKGALCNLWPVLEFCVFTVTPGKTPNQ